MYRIHNRRAIINRKALIGELEEQTRWGAGSPRGRANALQIFKAALYRGVGEIRGRFEAEAITGAEVVQANAFLVDQLVRCIYDFANTRVYPSADRRWPSDQMAVAATGGYGRGELAPFSDIDVMFLLPGQTDRAAGADRRVRPLHAVGFRPAGRSRHPLGRRLRAPGEGRPVDPHQSARGALAMGR